MCDFLRSFGKNTSYYILPKRQGPSLLAQILLKPNTPKVYMSFPITGISKDVKREIARFKKEVSSHLVAFDPFAIRDRELTFQYFSLEEEIKQRLKKVVDHLCDLSCAGGNEFWALHIDEDTPLTLIKFTNLKTLGFPEVKILGREHLMTIKTIDAQIIARDYLLIDQADFIILYIRTDDKGQPRISAGCQSELTYAYTHGKEVNVIYKGGEKKLSPWITTFSNVFETINECLNYIREKYIG